MSVALLTVALLTPAQPPAANPPRFAWKAGETHAYKVTQNTVVRETTLDPKTEKPRTSEARTKLTLVKKWAVKSVDEKGVATLEMTIVEMRNEMGRPDGSTVVLDSSNAEDAKAMAGYINVPVVVARVDSQGRLVEVKETKAGSAARLNAELPFRMILPDAAPPTTWNRDFTMKLDPPLGTGETHDFIQKFTAGQVENGLLKAAVETSLKSPPKALSEQVPLVPMLWTGEVYFNTVAGKYHAARLKAKAELPNYQGEGTKFEYESTYVEDVIAK